MYCEFIGAHSSQIWRKITNKLTYLALILSTLNKIRCTFATKG